MNLTRIDGRGVCLVLGFESGTLPGGVWAVTVENGDERSARHGPR